MMLLLCTSVASAFGVSHYATQSKLATGKWVKISIAETGVYEITYDELRDMGFNNPSSVRLYGFGGSRINEVLNGSVIDDLKAVPVMRYNNKLCFYGNGPVNFIFSDYLYTRPYFKRQFNPYSQVGCYFLTEESTAENVMDSKPEISLGTYVNNPNSMCYTHHESELGSFSATGKDMLGEDFTFDRVLIDYDLPDLADSTVNVSTGIASYTTNNGYASAVLYSGGAADTAPFPVNTSSFNVPNSDKVIYRYVTPRCNMKLTHPSEHGQFEPKLGSDSTDFEATMARLDYFTISYTHRNVIREEYDNQTIMTYAKPAGNERILLPNATSTTQVWSITNTYDPMRVPLKAYNDAAGQGYAFFAPAAQWSQYVAFDPTKTLKKIVKYEPVANQNLHSLQTPDMLIITDSIFHEQAERLAEMHRTVDGMDVLVVDQDLIINEFSSGTRDAMAYRLFCKMLYDRNPSKFKYLLLMGPGTLDNRGIFGEHPSTLITYQSDNSHEANKSYTSDDFYGFLDDNSGAAPSAERLTIGVGRITCANEAEARSDVDKLIEYYTNPDYGVWRNNNLVFSDSPDSGKYMYHGEGYKNQIDNQLQTGMNVTTVHNSMYPRSNTQPNVQFDRKEADVAKQKIAETFKKGVFFATYVGHAGPIAFTKYNNMWVTNDVLSTRMSHLPIVSTACCDVARYDGDLRCIAEVMFHKRDGGAIALLTTSRMVYGDENDQMNRYFVNALFSNAATGHMPTLGEAYRQSKLSFPTSNDNKMSFFLLGDPAMKINYPVSRFNITKVNTTDMTDTSAMAQISPLMKFDIEAKVLDDHGNVDTGFNGDATFTLYDRDELFAIVGGYVGLDFLQRDIYTDREKLAEISGRVTNGVFRGQMIAPRNPEASNVTVLLRAYAHQDNSSVMVNGFTKRITMLPYDESAAISDVTAPVVNSMFINDEVTFANGAIVAPEAILYVSASDDQGISMQANSVDKDITLLLDGKESFSDVDSYITAGDGGKVVNLEYPLANLTEGQHTLTFIVYDMLGNSATHTISFIVGQNSVSNIVADKLPAYNNGEVAFDMEESILNNNTKLILRVTDASGKLVWMTTADSFPVTWNMRDMNGRKVPAGLYRYFATYNDGVHYGGTPINKLIVLDPVKVAKK